MAPNAAPCQGLASANSSSSATPNVPSWRTKGSSARSSNAHCEPDLCAGSRCRRSPRGRRRGPNTQRTSQWPVTVSATDGTPPLPHCDDLYHQSVAPNPWRSRRPAEHSPPAKRFLRPVTTVEAVGSRVARRGSCHERLPARRPLQRGSPAPSSPSTAMLHLGLRVSDLEVLARLLQRARLRRAAQVPRQSSAA